MAAFVAGAVSVPTGGSLRAGALSGRPLTVSTVAPAPAGRPAVSGISMKGQSKRRVSFHLCLLCVLLLAFGGGKGGDGVGEGVLARHRVGIAPMQYGLMGGAGWRLDGGGVWARELLEWGGTWGGGGSGLDAGGGRLAVAALPVVALDPGSLSFPSETVVQ